jgi:DNA-3-methyladenine glycosylase II
VVPIAANRLSPVTHARGLAWLGEKNALFGGIRARYGDPPFWSREPGFPALVHIVLEQQVSLASARAAYERLLEAVGRLTPSAFLEFDDLELKAFGFSRQKTATCRRIARAVLDRELDLARLAGQDDATVKSELVKIKGIGPWTADIYLLMALGRPDVFPSGDLAVASAAQDLMALDERPEAGLLDELALQWRPWRSIAARLLWHYYLSSKARSPRKHKRSPDQG